MKKLILTLLILLFPVIGVSAKTCVYNTSSSDFVKRVELTLEQQANGSFKIVGGNIDTNSSVRMPIGYMLTSSGTIELSGNKNTYTFGDCPAKIGLTHPISAGVGILKINDCDGALEYGCFTSDGGGVDSPDVPVEPSNKYEDIISCRDSGYKYIKECGCMPSALADLISNLFMVIKIAAPALLLIVGGFDLIKAMSAQDEKGIKKEQQKLVKKFIAAAAIFLIFTIVQFLVTTLANNSGNIIKCVDYLLNGYNV